MKLKDVHSDIERYLAEDCYCPGEIYDISGFFYQVFNADEECMFVTEGESRNSELFIKCVTCKNQLLNFWISRDEDKVVDAERYDATVNNVNVMKKLLSGEDTEVLKLDEFEDGATVKALEDVLIHADAVLIS